MKKILIVQIITSSKARLHNTSTQDKQDLELPTIVETEAVAVGQGAEEVGTTTLSQRAKSAGSTAIQHVNVIIAETLIILDHLAAGIVVSHQTYLK